MGLATHRVPIEADVLLISPFIIILTTLALNWILRSRFYLVLSIISLIALGNIYFLISTGYKTNLGNSKIGTFQSKNIASEEVLMISNGRPYNLIGKGPLSDFPSFTMPYEYILWWKGSAPQEEDTPLKIQVWEKDGEIIVEELP
jgi:hypothetical protein